MKAKMISGAIAAAVFYGFAQANAQIGPVQAGPLGGVDDSNVCRLIPFVPPMGAVQIGANATTIDTGLAGAGFTAANGWNFTYDTGPALASVESDLSVTLYQPWVVNQPNVTLPDATVRPGMVMGADAGGANFIVTYTPKPGDPTNVHFIQAYSDSVGGVASTMLDNAGAANPYYDTNGVAGTYTSPMGQLPNGTSWYEDRPFDTEPASYDTITPTDPVFVADVNFQVLVATVSGANNVTLYGGYEWGYHFTSADTRCAILPHTGSAPISWENPSTWTNGIIPQTATTEADFDNALSPSTEVTLDGPVTTSVIDFSTSESNSYFIAPGTGGTLTLNNLGAGAAIFDDGGSHFILAPVILADNALISVTNTTDTLTITGNITGPGGLTVGGFGTVALSGNNSFFGPTSINSGTLVIASPAALPISSLPIANNGSLVIGSTGVVSGSITGAGSLTVEGPSTGGISTPGRLQIFPGAGPSQQSALLIGPGSTLDLTNNQFIINYGSGTSPEPTIQAWIGSAYNNGMWNGPGITSSFVASLGGAYALGYADGTLDTGTAAQPGEVLIRLALIGDANLDGTVNLTDLLTLLNSYGQTGKDWADGDFNYDGTVNLTDLLGLLNNYGESSAFGQSVPGRAQAVPEPATAGVLAIGCLVLSRRTRRVSHGSVTDFRTLCAATDWPTAAAASNPGCPRSNPCGR